MTKLNIREEAVREFEARAVRCAAALRRLAAVEARNTRHGPLYARQADRLNHHHQKMMFSMFEIIAIVDEATPGDTKGTP